MVGDIFHIATMTIMMMMLSRRGARAVGSSFGECYCIQGSYDIFCLDVHICHLRTVRLNYNRFFYSNDIWWCMMKVSKIFTAS